MKRRLQGWKVGRWIALGMFLSNIPTFQLSAQVGHDPGNSPYHDINLHPGPMFFVGHLSGDRGKVQAGTTNALTFGGRYEIPAGRALQFQFTGAFLRGDRFIINPSADSNAAARRTGPVKSDLAQIEIGMLLRLTGGKTWHGFAPYAGPAIGLVLDAHSPGDTTSSRYQFGTKFTLAFASGVRWYPARRVILNADLRALFWRLKYPASFHTPLSPDQSRVIPLTESLTDWTVHPWVTFGLGWTF